MVKTLHAAGIEVILDVVYNHTAEGNHLGPTLSMRGIDNQAYYRTMDDDPRYYLDFTGTGNSLNMRHPHVLQLIMDSLRYWVTRDARRRLPLRPRVDAGPRAVRGRPAVGVLRPRPAGSGGLAGEADRRAVGHRRGRLPGRQLPAAVVASGTAGTATRSATSGAASPRRSPSSATASPAAPTCTRPTPGDRPRRSTSSPPTTGSRSPTSCRTTTSTTRPTARAATTASRTTGRGTTVPRARPTTPTSTRFRTRQRRNLMTTLLLSQGVPMLLGGDELGRTQGGNNNAYCQDNEISWYDWERRRHRLRQVVPTGDLVPSQTTRCSGAAAGSRAARIRGIDDLAWLRPDGEEMTDDDWDAGYARAVGGLHERRRRSPPPTRTANASSTTPSS